MKSNFNLRTFLTENKLTSNSKLVKEADFAPAPNSDVMDANGEDFNVATAFKKARVDMSKPVSVRYMSGHAQYATVKVNEMSAEDAIKKIEAERQEVRKGFEDDGREVPSDLHGYEFDNYTTFEEDLPEGHEYKLSYYLGGDYTYVITQEKAEVSEADGKGHDEEIISYIADTYIQNAKDGDRAYAEFRDLNIRDAVQDVVGILQDPKHPLHGETKKEYQIVSRDKARGLF